VPLYSKISLYQRKHSYKKPGTGRPRARSDYDAGPACLIKGLIVYARCMATAKLVRSLCIARTYLPSRTRHGASAMSDRWWSEVIEFRPR